MLPQAATAVPRDRDSIEPGAETGPAGAPADAYQREYEAMREWAYPHKHYWEYAPKKHGGYVCLGCGQVKQEP